MNTVNLAISILGAIFAIFSVVIIHECGHFFVARWMGVRVLRFSIGFGKALWSTTTKSGTEFVIALLPLGGYVRMLGEGDDAAPEDLVRYAYNHKPILARMAIVLAGPMMNFLLAILLFWVIFLSGVTHVTPTVGQVLPNSIAAKSGLHSGDVIQKIDAHATPNWQRVMMAFIARVGDQSDLHMRVLPKGSTQPKSLTLSLKNWVVPQSQSGFFKSLGIVPFRPKFPTIVGQITRASPAEKGRLKQGDKILAVNGMKQDDMLSIIKIIQSHPGKSIRLTISRDGKLSYLDIIPGTKKQNDKAVGYLGFMVTAPTWPAHMISKQSYSLWSAWAPAVKRTWALLTFNANVLYKMIFGKISLRTLGGPITIFHVAGKASQHNYRVYLGFVAFISVTLGFINLLPIPGLDGGHFFFQVIEAIFRRPIPERIQVICVKIGILLLILLMLQATFNDITRLFL